MAKHWASWAGRCPGHGQSAGHAKTGKTRKGNRWRRQGLLEAAHGAASTQSTDLVAWYRRLSARQGKKKAWVVVSHARLESVYPVAKRRVPYPERGENDFDEPDR